MFLALNVGLLSPVTWRRVSTCQRKCPAVDYVVDTLFRLFYNAHRRLRRLDMGRRTLCRKDPL
jgi:hypothetical protein